MTVGKRGMIRTYPWNYQDYPRLASFWEVGIALERSRGIKLFVHDFSVLLLV